MTLMGNLYSLNNGTTWKSFTSLPSANALGWNGTNYIYGASNMGNSSPTYVMTDLFSNFVALPPPFGTNDIISVNVIKWNGKQWLIGTTSSSTNQVMMSYCSYNWISTSVSGFAQANYPCNGIAWNGILWVVSGLTQYGTYLAYSSDGINWAQSSNTLGGGLVEWNDSYFICAGPGMTGTTTTISKSTDGVNWTSQIIGNYGIIQGIAWNGNSWVITTNSTSTYGILSSYDGSNWTPQGAILSSYSLTGVIWNGISFLINTTTNNILQSYSGINWNSITTPNTGQNGNQFTWTTPNSGRMNILQPTIIGGSGTYTTMAYSNDGIYYISLGNNIFSTSCNSIAWNGRLWVAGGSGINTLAYSYDGILWFGNGSSIFTSSCNNISWNGTIFLALGSGTNTFATSTNGIIWSVLSTNVIDISGISADWNGYAWVAVGKGTQNTIAYSSSVNAIANTWVGIGNTCFTNIGNGVKWMYNKWVVVGSGGNTLLYSNSIVPIGSNSWISNFVSKSVFSSSANNVFWNGNVAVAVGSGIGNTMATSINGIEWTGIGNTNLSVSGSGVFWNGQRWVAVGAGSNNVIYSYNGSTWYNALNTNSMFSSLNCVASNSKIGIVYVNSGIYLKTGDSLIVTSPSAYDSALSNDTSISIQMNLV